VLKDRASLEVVWQAVVARQMELKEGHIRANVLSPGATETPVIDGLFDSKEAAEVGRGQFISATPLGRMGRPEEIASAALF
jgi:NAD(P)-dependent dehydrogenase (short-subunit alcohol dehydrogenase family)